MNTSNVVMFATLSAFNEILSPVVNLTFISRTTEKKYSIDNNLPPCLVPACLNAQGGAPEDLLHSLRAVSSPAPCFVLVLSKSEACQEGFVKAIRK